MDKQIDVLTSQVEELNLRVEALEAQRNSALTDHVIVTGKLGLARQRIASLEKMNGQLQEKVKALEPPVPAPVQEA